MNNPKSTHPYIVVVGVDYSDTGTRALHRAFELASRESNAEPHVVAVAGASGPMLRVELPDEIAVVTIEEASKHLKDYVQKELEKFQKGGGSLNFARVVTHVRVGAPAHEVAQLAADLEADIVVVGTHGRRGAQRLLLGSVAEGTVRLTQCPVLVVRPKDYSDGIKVPQIAPPCPRCVEARKASGGENLWCSQHSERHGARHTYHYVSRNSGARENMGLTFR